jgi:hypothetical protein
VHAFAWKQFAGQALPVLHLGQGVLLNVVAVSSQHASFDNFIMIRIYSVFRRRYSKKSRENACAGRFMAENGYFWGFLR